MFAIASAGKISIYMKNLNKPKIVHELFSQDIVRATEMIYRVIDGLIPSGYLLKSIKSATTDRKNGNIHSFKNDKTAIDFLDN